MLKPQDYPLFTMSVIIAPGREPQREIVFSSSWTEIYRSGHSSPTARASRLWRASPEGMRTAHLPRGI